MDSIDFDRSGMNDEERLQCENDYWNLPGEKEAYWYAQNMLMKVLQEYSKEFAPLRNRKGEFLSNYELK